MCLVIKVQQYGITMAKWLEAHDWALRFKVVYVQCPAMRAIFQPLIAKKATTSQGNSNGNDSDKGDFQE